MTEAPGPQPQRVGSLTGLPEEPVGFTDGQAVDVREIDDRQWSLLREFTYRGRRESYVVQAGELTDFASVPRPFVWFIPTYGRYTKAAILHDYLCRLSLEGRFNRRDADGLFRQAMRSLGVAFLRRWIMWAAVRWGALATADGRKDWLADAWLVLPITLLVAPILSPAAILVGATLLAWYVAELVAWPALALIDRGRRSAGKPAKKVNAPELALRL